MAASEPLPEGPAAVQRGFFGAFRVQVVARNTAAHPCQHGAKEHRKIRAGTDCEALAAPGTFVVIIAANRAGDDGALANCPVWVVKDVAAFAGKLSTKVKSLNPVVGKLPTTELKLLTLVGKLLTKVGSLNPVVGSSNTLVKSLNTVVGKLPTTVGSLNTVVGSFPTTVGKQLTNANGATAPVLYLFFQSFTFLAIAPFLMKLNTSYNEVKNETLSLFGHSVVEKTATSPFIANGADLAKPLALALQTLDDDVTAVIYPTPAQNAQRDLYRKAVRTEMGRLAAQLNLAYPANEAALLSSGLTMGQPSGSHARKPGELDPPTEIELFDGSTPGCLLVRGKRPTGAMQNIIRASDNPAVPAEEGRLFVGGGREREIGPFPSGAVVEVVWACLAGSTTSLNYSASVSRRVQ